MPDEAKGETRPARAAAQGGAEGRATSRSKGTRTTPARTRPELQARPRARRGREALSLRAAPGAAPQDQRDQLRRREADRAEQDARRPRAEPPRRHQGPHLAAQPGLLRSGIRASCARTAARRGGPGAERRRSRRMVRSGTSTAKRQHFRRVLRVPLPVDRTPLSSPHRRSRSAYPPQRSSLIPADTSIARSPMRIHHFSQLVCDARLLVPRRPLPRRRTGHSGSVGGSAWCAADVEAESTTSTLHRRSAAGRHITANCGRTRARRPNQTRTRR